MKQQENPKAIEIEEAQPDTSSHLFTNYHPAYTRIGQHQTYISENTSFEGEPIEYQVERMLNNGEPIGTASPQIFTDRKDGVLPEHDIRTDKFEVAMDATDLAAKNQLKRRQDFLDTLNKQNTKPDTGPTGGTDTKPNP